MTRFARAQGSKSSNERSPHEATLWTEFKQQFISKKNEADPQKRKEFLELREEKYKIFLKEHSAKQTDTWADFSDMTEPNYIVLNKEKEIKLNDNIGNNNDEKKKKRCKRKLEESLDIPDADIELRKNEVKVVKVENAEEDCKSTGKVKKRSKKRKTVQPESVEQCCQIKPTVQKVEKTFANDNERSLYEKKLARRARQKERVKERKAILATNEDNRLTQVLKEKVAKIKQKRLQKVLERKAERERLKGISETTEISNEKGSTEITSKKKRKKKKKSADINMVKEVPENVNIVKKLEGSAVVKIGKKDKLMRKRKVFKTECQTEANENMSVQKKIGKKNKLMQKRKVSENEVNENMDDPKKDKLMQKRKVSETEYQSEVNENMSDQKKKNRKTTEIQTDINGNESGKIIKNKKKSLLSDEGNTTEASNGQRKEDTNNFSENKRKFKGQERNNPSTKEHKLKDSKWTGEHRKKTFDSETTTLRLNGRSIEIALFDGFPVKKDDYQRLAQLRKDMISKGVPRSEVQRAMQLERRRAEKALAREKKEVCFNCRKAGHKLTECPKAMIQETEATGICFKCGSTEHTHFQCKVVQQQQFKFATCFICREPGHIAKQCPQNVHGIYPQGGSCKMCGDVTHLKKDCPQYQAQQEHNAIHVDTIDGANLEALDKSEVKVKAIAAQVKKVKVVKF